MSACASGSGILERYPGTNSASSYASEVTLIDHRKGIHRDQRIYMNNILNYDGYRFFQSSFDQDELKEALYSENSLRGNAIISRNTYGEESKLDLEMLYKAIVTSREKIHSVFN